jgi:signal peptidase I
MSDTEPPNDVEYDPTSVDVLPEPKKPKPIKSSSIVAEWVGIILAAFVVSLLIKTYVVQTFYIPSASMENTLLINDHLLVNKLSYRWGNVKQGDIVVFKTPPKEPDKSINDLIKRVIALPGDTFQEQNGVVYVNGKPLSEPYTLPDRPGASYPETVIPPGDYWVMGDNRGDSSDSRIFGPISKSLIVGKAELRIWPLNRFGSL